MTDFGSTAGSRVWLSPDELKGMTMIERVQKAIQDTIYAEVDDAETQSSVGWIKQEVWVKISRAVLEEIREPTEAMVTNENMNLGGYGFNDECFAADPKEIWQAMIDAALSEEKNNGTP